jgi:hypothetical protein
MAVLSRFMHMVRGANPQGGRMSPALAADRARQLTKPFAPPTQTANELATTRRHMEAELDTQREERTEAAKHKGGPA